MTSTDFRAGLLRAAEIAKNVQDAMWTKWSTTALEQFVLARNIVVEAIRAEAAAIKDEPSDREGFYEKLWKDFVSLQRGDVVGICERVERYYREKDEPKGSAPQYTLAQKAAAFEWLRSLALDEANPKALHAGVMLCEVAKLDQLRERNAI